MCWIVVKQEGSPLPYEYIKEAQGRNKDGYGVSWYADGELHTYKTLDFTEFLAKLKEAEIEKYRCVIHLRKTSAGATNTDNIHPFDVPSGQMFHNGTIFSLKPQKTYIHGVEASCGEQSDTSTLAEMLRGCVFEKPTDIEPLLQHVIGTTLNKLVFFNNDGSICIFNKRLGIDELAENGCWMSNDYHVPKEKSLVFVYGTLKESYHNHHWMEGIPYVGEATLEDKWAMIEGPGFPYLLKKDEDGHNVKGEIYDASDDDLDNLDILEGAPFHYHRRKVKAILNGVTIDVVTYVKTRVSETDLEEDFIEEF